MPIREYQCADCGHVTERVEFDGDKKLGQCPECGGSVRRLLAAPSFQFKGSGWYVTDYAGKGSGDGNGGGGSGASAEGAGSATKPKAKPEASKESPAGTSTGGDG